MIEQSQAKDRVKSLTNAINSKVDIDMAELTRLHIERAHCFNILGEHPKSVGDYLTALDFAEIDDDIVHIKSMISLAFLELDNKEEGIWWALAAVEQDGQNPEGQYTFALNCSFSKFDKLAIEALAKTIELKPDHWPAHLELGTCLREECRLPESLEVLTKFVNANPADSKGLFELGWTTHVSIHLADRIPRAMALYKRALECEPKPRLRRMINEKLSSLEEHTKD